MSLQPVPIQNVPGVPDYTWHRFFAQKQRLLPADPRHQ